tara:strand:- start:354 stop:1133 length:780 start_codon:yes stop_codon:yes gene_type:complete
MSNFTDDEGNALFNEIAGTNDDIELIYKSVDVLNKSKGLTGEEYIAFKAVIDRIFSETKLNNNAIELFHKTNSTGFNCNDISTLYETPDQAHKLFKWHRMDRAWRLFYRKDKNRNIVANDMSADKMYNTIREKIHSRLVIDFSWPHQLGSQLILIRDYWGNYVAHQAQGQLKPIDFAICLQGIIDTVGNYLYKQDKEQTIYSTKQANQMADEALEDTTLIRWWIEDYIKANPNYVHPTLQEVLDRIEETKDDSDTEGGE